MESLSSEELAYACNLPSFQLDAEGNTQPANVLGGDGTQPSEIKQLSSKGKKKKRKRTVSKLKFFSSKTILNLILMSYYDSYSSLMSFMMEKT